MHTAMLPQHPPQTIPFSNLPQLSSTPASSSYEEVCATNLRQQDPASSSPRIIQASSPLLALQTAGGNNHAARSIFVGDQAWPPIRPPIHPPRAGTRDAEFSQVAPDIGVEAQRARDAFREPQEFRSLGETHAAASACFASLMARVRPNTQSGLSMTSTRPSAPAPSETAGRIVSAGFQDPEASVTTCEVCPRPAPSRMPRTITRAEMNRRWRLNDPPARSRILQAADETGGTLGAVTSTPPARPADIQAAVRSGSEKVTRQVQGLDHDGAETGGSDHGRCAQAAVGVACVAPPGGAVSTEAGMGTSRNDETPRYNQLEVRGKAEAGGGETNIPRCSSMRGNNIRGAAALVPGGSVESCGEEGSNTEERDTEGASYVTPPSNGRDPPVVQNDGRTLPHVDPPTESGALANAWRVTADVVVKMDGTPGRVLSCTVDTQWHGTTVRTLPLRDSLLAGLSLAEDERLARILRIIPGEEAIRCLGGARELWTLDTQMPTRVLCVTSRESVLHHLWSTEGLSRAYTQMSQASRVTDMSSDDTTWRVAADLIVRTDGTLVRTLNHTLDTPWRGTIVRTLPLQISLLAGLSLKDDERLIRVLRVAPREEAIRCLLGAQRLWPPDNPQQTQVLCVASWQDSLRHLCVAEGLDEGGIRGLWATRFVNSPGQATEHVARVRVPDSDLDHRELTRWTRELTRWTVPPELGLSSHVMPPRAAPRTMAMVGHPESETASGGPPAGPDSWQAHPSLAMPERGGVLTRGRSGGNGKRLSTGGGGRARLEPPRLARRRPDWGDRARRRLHHRRHKEAQRVRVRAGRFRTTSAVSVPRREPPSPPLWILGRGG